jgi:hypothetical protein
MTGSPYTNSSDLQEFVDTFYHAHGKCCAGCDWWRYMNSTAGECTKSAPVLEGDRVGMLGMTGGSLEIGAGHVLTRREHVCGDFKDEYDWPKPGRRKV